MLAVYISVFSFVTIMVSLRYELAIPLSRSVSRTLAIMKLCSLIIFFIVILFFIVLLISGHFWLETLKINEFQGYLWLFPLGVLVAGFHKVFNFWMLKKKAFAVMALSRTLQGGGMVSSQIALGYLSLGFVGLIAGHIIGFTVGLLVLLWFSFQSQFLAIRNIRLNLIKKVAFRYKKFPKFSIWSDMLNVFGTQFPPLMIAGLFSIQYAGFYLLANRVANAPVALMAEAVGKSFMAISISHRKKNTLATLSLQIYKLLFKLGLGPMSVVIIIAPELFSIAFGEQWGEAGLYLQLMIPWVFSVFIFVPLMTLYIVLEQQKVEFRFQLALIIMRLTGLAIGASIAGITGAILLYSLFAALVYTLCGGWIMHKVGVALSQMIKVAFKEVLFVAFWVSPLYGMKLFLLDEIEDISNWQSISFFAFSLGLVVVFLLRSKPLLLSLNQAGKKTDDT
ncbi:MAG: oligosaccharide flippase family protein [Methylococcaceae bacterium]|nr:oligosaccharide flippase family protein [Methylococcaceae bacterium]